MSPLSTTENQFEIFTTVKHKINISIYCKVLLKAA